MLYNRWMIHQVFWRIGLTLMSNGKELTTDHWHFHFILLLAKVLWLGSRLAKFPLVPLHGDTNLLAGLINRPLFKPNEHPLHSHSELLQLTIHQLFPVQFFWVKTSLSVTIAKKCAFLRSWNHRWIVYRITAYLISMSLGKGIPNFL